jgi:hypothetical protein
MSWSRSVLASAWVGWQRELGWTNPAVSFIMKLATPVGSVLTAAIVYWLGSSVAGAYDGARLSYVVVGASMYAHISVYSAVPVWAISEGKWSFVFPQVYISPTSSIPYLTGRSVASFLISAITSLFSLLFA